MEDKENIEKNGNKTMQQITVPFLWEVKPGQPKENWQETPKRESLTHVTQPAVKYVASVPFKWEEKPGTPLECFVQEAEKHTVSETLSVNRSLQLPLPPAYFANYGTESDGDSSYGDEFEYQYWMSEIDFEVGSIVSDESFCSAPSLLQAKADNLTPSKVSVSSTVKLQNPFLTQAYDDNIEGSSSPEDSCSPRSYASRNASLRGAAFLQYLFPLYPPKSAFLDKPDSSKSTKSVHNRTELKLPTVEENKKLGGTSKRSGVIRRPLTLEELIIQRRRMSYRRKAVQMKKKNTPKDFDEDNRHGCFNFGSNAGRQTELFGKDLLTLKLS
ncbi:hypothetical protein RND81_12G120100 [Saponaria officinalis]|uniref:Uncharacterized protein n=1 Tax=Saponaria officinalis TaxID=3572 RepID=A0AAW1H9I8_SAPOF